MKNELIKIPLQFFGESDKDDYDDFDDEYEDEEGKDEEDEDSDGDEDSEDADEDDADDDAKEDDGGDDKGEESGDETADLIAELKALGYEGDDVKSLTASVKAPREASEKEAAVAERRATMKAGKAHVKSSNPSKRANGDGMAGYTEKDVKEVEACLKKKKSESQARAAIERRLRAGSR